MSGQIALKNDGCCCCFSRIRSLFSRGERIHAASGIIPPIESAERVIHEEKPHQDRPLSRTVTLADFSGASKEPAATTSIVEDNEVKPEMKESQPPLPFVLRGEGGVELIPYAPTRAQTPVTIPSPDVNLVLPAEVDEVLAVLVPRRSPSLSDLQKKVSDISRSGLEAQGSRRSRVGSMDAAFDQIEMRRSPSSESESMTKVQICEAVFKRYPSFVEQIQALREIMADPVKGATEDSVLENFRQLFPAQKVEKFGAFGVNVIIGDGNPGSAGLYLGEQIMLAKLRGTMPKAFERDTRNLSIICASEGKYKKPENFFEVFYPCDPERGLTSWDDLCDACRGETGDLEKLFRVVSDALLRKDSEGVFVHCQKGEDRSACIVWLVLIYLGGLTINEAELFLKARRPQASPGMIRIPIETRGDSL